MLLQSSKLTVKCICGIEAHSGFSKKENINKGRKYFSCGQSEKKKCEFFKWEKKSDIFKVERKPIAASSITTYRLSSSCSDTDRTIHIYTDGSCIGNQNVQVSFCPAGWGVVIIAKAFDDWKILEELYGPVVLDTKSPFSLGATVGSNNTGELSAIGEALLWLKENNDPAVYPAAVIHYDSEYAAKSVTGEFNGPKNRPLYSKIRDILQRLTAVEAVSPMRIDFEHVKGHSNDIWNDRADRLANKGSSGLVCSAGRYGISKDDSAEKKSCVEGSTGNSRKGESVYDHDTPKKKVKQW